MQGCGNGKSRMGVCVAFAFNSIMQRQLVCHLMCAPRLLSGHRESVKDQEGPGQPGPCVCVRVEAFNFLFPRLLSDFHAVSCACLSLSASCEIDNFISYKQGILATPPLSQSQMCVSPADGFNGMQPLTGYVFGLSGLPGLAILNNNFICRQLFNMAM